MFDFRYYIPGHIHFKTGICGEIGKYITELSIENVLIVTDSNISSLSWFKALVEIVDRVTNKTYIFDRIHCEPTDEDVNSAIAYADNKYIDGIIGIGGGSSMDSSKCVAAALSVGSASIEPFLRPGNRAVDKKLPLILIPTTAGTGAEITRGAVIIDKNHKIKRGFGNGGYYANTVLIDPNLGCTLKKEQIATSGLDALCHAMESFLVNKTHPICKIWAENALKLVWENLPKMYQSNDLVYRENMFLGSLLATMSFSTGVGLTFSHHISDVLGGIYTIPHGYASFYTLPNTIRMFEKNGENMVEFNQLGLIFSSNNIADSLEELAYTLNVPSYTEYFPSMTKESIDDVFKRVMENSYRASGLAGDELLQVLKKSFGTNDVV